MLREIRQPLGTSVEAPCFLGTGDYYALTLEHAYGVLNEEYFDGVLPPVVITVQSSPKAYGHYTTWDAWRQDEKGYREINLGAENLSRAIELTISTLLHEMVVSA